MPCVRSNLSQQRRFLPHFPPGSMRCRFGPELVSPLPHAMMHVFPMSENDPICGSSASPPPSPLTPITSSLPLIPKPPGEVSRVGRGGYTLKNVLEQEHGWENGLYNKIRVKPTLSHCNYHTQTFAGKSMLSGGQISGHVRCLFHSSSKPQEQTSFYL